MLSRALSSMLSCALPSMRALEAWPPPPPPPCKRDGPAGRHCLTNLDSANGRGVEGGQGVAKGALGGGGCQLSGVPIGDASPQPSCTLTHHTRLSYGIARPVALRGLKLGPLLGRQGPCRCMQAGSAQAAALAGLCARGVGPFSSLQRALPDLMSTPPARRVCAAVLHCSGAFGRVYRGTWRGASVAVKILSTWADPAQGTSATPAQLEALLRCGAAGWCSPASLASSAGLANASTGSGAARMLQERAALPGWLKPAIRGRPEITRQRVPSSAAVQLRLLGLRCAGRRGVLIIGATPRDA
jgi:hypothetical protein